MVKIKVETTRSVELRELVDKDESSVSISRQCELLGMSTSSFYYKPKEPSKSFLSLRDEVISIYTEFPYYGSRKMAKELQARGFSVGRKLARTLMKSAKIEAIYQKPNTSKSHPDHKIYPYLLRELDINRPNQVWCTDITYVRVDTGWVYLMAVMDWYSRKVISWSISNTMDNEFCTRVLEDSLKHGKPEIFNTDQGSQFTSLEFTNILKREGIKISMDGKGRYLDNILIERLWRTVKYEDIVINGYETLSSLKKGLAEYIEKYNGRRLHQALGYKTPNQIWQNVV